VSPSYLISFGLMGLSVLLMVLTYTLILSPVGRALPLTVEKTVMPLCFLMLFFLANLFRIAMRGVGDFYDWWEPYMNLGLVLMMVLVVFFTAYASARKQIKAAQTRPEAAA
jgi:hypothetical protein